MTHHAYLLLGDFPWALTIIPKEDSVASLDVLHYTGLRMGIDDVRALIVAVNRMPLSREYITCVIAYDALTNEAQNALLKLLEEPPQAAQFYIVASSESQILPTLRSRLFLLAEKKFEAYAGEEFREFFEASHAARLTLIAAYTAAKNDVWVTALMSGIEQYAAQKGKRELLGDVMTMRMHLEAPGASKKMILEHLALSL